MDIALKDDKYSIKNDKLVVKQKQFERWCIEDNKRFANSWEYGTIANGAWVDGYKAFRDKLVAELKAKYEGHTGDFVISVDHMIELLEKHGENEVTTEFSQHQFAGGGPKFNEVSED